MPTTVRAKFKVQSVTDYGHQLEAKCSAIYGKDGENSGFASATPSGDFRLCITKGLPATEFFKAGECIYLDITPAPAS